MGESAFNNEDLMHAMWRYYQRKYYIMIGRYQVNFGVLFLIDMAIFLVCCFYYLALTNKTMCCFERGGGDVLKARL